MLNVFWRRHLCGFPVLSTILPEVLKFLGGLHFGTCCGRAKLGDGAVEKVDLVVEINNYSATMTLLALSFFIASFFFSFFYEVNIYGQKLLAASNIK